MEGVPAQPGRSCQLESRLGLCSSGRSRGPAVGRNRDGLNAFDPKTEHFRVYSVPGMGTMRVRAMAEDSQGVLWLATLYNGVLRFDPGTGQFTVYRHSEAAGSLSNDAVAAICVDRSGAIWAGTANGLNRLDAASGKFTAYYERDGLSGNNVKGVQEDQRGDLWMVTNNGLSRFDRASGTFRNYYQSDGIPGDLISVWKGRTGDMFVGSYNGLIRFFPDRVTATEYVPPVVLTGFQIGDKPAGIGGDSPLKQSISLTDSLVLSHQQLIFSFEFAALSFANPSLTRYRYKLEGLESGWNEVDATERSVRYTTLSPRDYVFRVQSRTNRGAWNENGASDSHSHPAAMVGHVAVPGSLRVGVLPGALGSVSLACSPNGRAAQPAVRRADDRAHPHCGGPSRHASTGVRQRVHAAGRRGRPGAARFTIKSPVESHFGIDVACERGGARCTARVAVAGWRLHASGTGVCTN